MRRNRIAALLAALLALGVMAGVAAAVPATKHVATASKPAKSAKAKRALHQFTGVVTAMDKLSLTVEKDGKQPQTRTFVRTEKTTTNGDLAKDARVTVYYRDEDGKAVAHKVVVKNDAEGMTR